MSKQATTTLTDFLLARIAEDETRDREAWLLDGLPDTENTRAIMSTTTAWRTHEVRASFRGLGWALVSAAWPPAARRRAARYADHPDYRQEWRP